MIDRITGHLERGEYSAVKSMAQAVLISPDASPEAKATAALLAVKAAMNLGEGLIACTFASKALGVAQESGREDLEGRAVYALGAAKLAVGDHPEARAFLGQYLTGLADRWPELDSELTARAYINLGQVYRAQRLYADSLKAYAQALVRFQQAGETHFQAMARHHMAWILMLDGAHVEAREHLDAVEAMDGLSPEMLTHQLCHRALLHMSTGEHAEATALVMELLHPNRPHTTAAHRSTAAYVAGKVALAVGHLGDAEHFAELALDYATASGWAHQINMATDLKRRVHAATSV